MLTEWLDAPWHPAGWEKNGFKSIPFVNFIGCPWNLGTIFWKLVHFTSLRDLQTYWTRDDLIHLLSTMDILQESWWWRLHPGWGVRSKSYHFPTMVVLWSSFSHNHGSVGNYHVKANFKSIRMKLTNPQCHFLLTNPGVLIFEIMMTWGL